MKRKLIPSKLDESTKAIDEIVAEIEQLGYDAEEVFAVRLAAEEAITNAVIHGNKEDPSKQVTVDYELTPRQVKICVQDEGEGFDPCMIPDPTNEENLLTPCGRGVLLMHKFMDDVSYTPKGNCVTLTKRRSASLSGGVIHNVEARVVSSVRFLGRFCRLRLNAPEIAAGIRPGQFVNALPGNAHVGKRSFGGWTEAREALGRDYSAKQPVLRRPFSLHRLYRNAEGEPDGTFSIAFAVLGPGTEALAGLSPGDTLGVLGPLGTPLELEGHRGLPAALVAGGMGLAPMLAVAEELSRIGRSTTLLIGGSAEDHIPARIAEPEDDGAPTLDEFRELGVEVKVVTEADDGVRTGLATDLLREHLEIGDGKREVIACGPREMLRETAGLCRASKVPCQVLMEEMMGCGFGACMSCSILTKKGLARVCVDGPAFDAEEILWEDEWGTGG